MDRGAWWAVVSGVARVGHDLVIKPPPPSVNFGLPNTGCVTQARNTEPRGLSLILCIMGVMEVPESWHCCANEMTPHAKH